MRILAHQQAVRQSGSAYFGDLCLPTRELIGSSVDDVYTAQDVNAEARRARTTFLFGSIIMIWGLLRAIKSEEQEEKAAALQTGALQAG